MFRALSVTLLLLAAACSRDSPPTANLRFVNADPQFASLEFEAEGVRHNVAPRAAGPVFHFPPGTLAVTVRPPSGPPSTFTVSLAEGDHFLVAYQLLLQPLRLDVVQAPPLPAASNPVVAYHGAGARNIPLDLYLVPAGSSLDGRQPDLPRLVGPAGGTVELLPGRYEIIMSIPFSGKHNIFFQSHPFDLAHGERMTLLGAPPSRYHNGPQPIVLGMGVLRTLEDSRPRIRLLAPVPPLGQVTFIGIDGVLTVDNIQVGAAHGLSYHVTAGQRTIFSLFGGAGIVAIEPGREYTQSWATRVPPVPSGFRLPVPAIDHPVPANAARVRLFVENAGRENVVAIDGQRLTYNNQSVGNAGIVFDRNPGPLRVEVFTPDGALSEGARTVTLAPDHYYAIRIFTATSQFASGVPVLRQFEVNSD